jgi:serine/threonine protein kinase/Flp pilus assembly protein TadD
VYKAQDLKLNRFVALKFLPPNVMTSKRELAHLRQEARTISSLNHPGIATIHDVDEAEEGRYLVLEYLPGGTLKDKLKQLHAEDGKLPVEEVVSYGIQMAEALAHAHRHGIIHRDVKTDNIMLTEDGNAKLTDFGVAILRDNAQTADSMSVVGTAAYMSPEQIRGEEVDHRTDIFSLGVVLYELVTSSLPFGGEFVAAVNYSILNDTPSPAGQLRPEVPAELEQIINRCLEKDRTKRYQAAAEIAADLKKMERHQLDAAKPPSGESVPVKARSRKTVWIAGVVAVILVAAGVYLFSSRSPSPSVSSKSIAVLPFENLSDNKEDEYFSDGITDDIIAHLSKITDLKVISRTSVMQYKGTAKHVREIGRELDVATVLEGSVRRSGNQLRIVAQLIDAHNEGHLWAETYDREMTQIFAIQSAVAQSIATALRATLSPDVQERIQKRQTENAEAYQLYLKGRFYWNKRRTDDLKTAIGYFTQAIEKDPGYAQAYAGLGSTYVLLPQYGLQPEENFQRAESAAKKAMSMDPTLAEAHAVLAQIARNLKWDWVDAEQHYRRAIELNPSYPAAHHWYSVFLVIVGRYEEGLRESKQAQELDPLSPIITMSVGDAFYATHQYERAHEQYRRALAINDNFAWSHLSLGAVYEVQGKFDDAIREYQQARALAGTGSFGLLNLGHVYARTGRTSEAQDVLNRLMQFAREGYSVSYDIAFVYHGLGDRENAFAWLERAYQERGSGLTNLGHEPLWDGLRPDPRFDALLKKMGLKSSAGPRT